MGNSMVVRQSGTGASGLWYQFLRGAFIAAVVGFVLCLLALSISTPAINYCAAKARLQFMTNSTLTDACQAEAAGGDTSCVKDGFKEARWREKAWFFIFLPLPLGILVIFSLIAFMMFEAVRLLWWPAAIWLTILGFCIGVCVIFMVVYTIQCKQHDFCVQLKEAFDITTYVKHGVPDTWWLLHLIAAGLLCISLCFIFGTSLFLENTGAWVSLAIQVASSSRPAD